MVPVAAAAVPGIEFLITVQNCGAVIAVHGLYISVSVGVSDRRHQQAPEILFTIGFGIQGCRIFAPRVRRDLRFHEHRGAHLDVHLFRNQRVDVDISPGRYEHAIGAQGGAGSCIDDDLASAAF